MEFGSPGSVTEASLCRHVVRAPNSPGSQRLASGTLSKHMRKALEDAGEFLLGSHWAGAVSMQASWVPFPAEGCGPKPRVAPAPDLDGPSERAHDSDDRKQGHAGCRRGHVLMQICLAPGVRLHCKYEHAQGTVVCS